MKVLVAVPNRGEINPYVCAVVTQMARYPHGHDVKFSFRPGKSTESIDEKRNHVSKHVVENGYDFLFFMDSDNPTVGLRNPLDLVDLDKDILALPTPIWTRAPGDLGRRAINWNTYRHRGGELNLWQDYVGEGLCEVDAAGTGAMLIARRVLEKLRPPFVREYDEWGLAGRGSDLLFCKRAREEGFKIWAHYDYPCNHFKTLDLLVIQEAMYERDIAHANRENLNTPEYWNRQWAGGEDQENEPPREERILPFYQMIVDKVGGKRVLDFGCGRGDLLAMLGEYAEGIEKAPEAVTLCRGRGLSVRHGDENFFPSCRSALLSPSLAENPTVWWDAIIATEVLEHIEDDKGLLETFFQHTNHVIYSVPNDCMPPGVEPEHLRVYTPAYCERITPHIKSITECGYWLVVEARR